MSDLIKLAAGIEEFAEYEPLPAGQYRAELREIEVRHSEKQPNGYLYMVFRVDPSDFPVDYDAGNAPDGVKLTYARVQLPDANNRRTVKPFKDMLKAMGLELQGSEFNPTDWIGREVQMLLSTGEYQGSPTNNVEKISPLPSV